jgi:hypothetical protein
MKLYDGETLLLSQYVYGRGVVISFPTPIKITAGADAKVDLEASGTAGKYGLVWIAGYTK